MDRLDSYRTAIQTLLEQPSGPTNPNEDIEDQLFFDPVRDHYQLMRVGWNHLKRTYHTVLLPKTLHRLWHCLTELDSTF